MSSTPTPQASPLESPPLNIQHDTETVHQTSKVTCSEKITNPVMPTKSNRVTAGLIKGGRAVQNHFLKHVGAGLVAAVAYFDPGNWSVDLQAGSQYGYKMLFVVLLAGIVAVILQALATKLGCVTRKDLATHCRHLLHDHPKYPRLVRWTTLYPLYVLSECAIVATDLCELLGSSIALVLFIPSLPLYAAVLLTALDVFVVLLFLDPSRSQGRPAKLFEGFIIILVFTVFVSFVILIVKVKPVWAEVFKGFLPSKTIGGNADALYTSIGVVGATVMPHAIFLGSSLATQNRDGGSFALVTPTHNQDGDDDSVDYSEESHKPLRERFGGWLSSIITAERVNGNLEEEKGPIDRLKFIRSHLKNAIIDIVLSLLCVAGLINSCILIVAATVFYFKTPPDERGSIPPASLFDTFDIINQKLGKAAGYIFAGSLLTAGQSAAITATLSGQIVSEGFIAWKLSPFLTRTTTRMIALVPATIVAAVVGKDGIDALLVASQFTLSLVLPFVVLPLVYLTSNERIMSVPVYESQTGLGTRQTQKENTSISKVEKGILSDQGLEKIVSTATDRIQPSEILIKQPSGERETGRTQIPMPTTIKSFRNGRPLMLIGYLIFICILGADTIAIISLGKKG